MTLRVEVALALLISLTLIQQCRCDQELSTSPSVSNWTCTCSLHQENQSYVLKYNCSASCDCITVGESKRDKWACICPADGFPKVAADSHDPICFTACKCIAGSLISAQASKKHIWSKVVLTILLCVVLAMLTFIVSLLYYVYRKDKCPVQATVFLSDKETSCNSASNLIISKTSAPETKVNIGSLGVAMTGCFHKTSFFCRSKTDNIYGTIIQFSYSQLECATNKFSNSNLIGLGGNSYVYSGQLKDGRTVAVKRMKIPEGPDGDSVFSTEVEVLSRLHHYHVVPLLGYCSEFRGKHAERLLVFEYMRNGNLRDCLDGGSGETITWSTRVAIAIGAARGLEYLHEAAAPRILHRDVKSTNILLDEDWRAKITDLGMAKRLRADGIPSCSNSPARLQGTFGYFAPEYAIVGRASLMSDVFSFGVVLLELITGRQPIHKSTNNNGESLVIWATPRLQDSRRIIAELPDPRLKGNFPEEEMHIMAYLARECLLLDPDARPTMGEVVQILSTVSPDKSRRRNIPLNLFQMSSAHKTKNNSYIEKSHNALESSNDEECPRQSISINRQPRSSLPLEIERTLCGGRSYKEADNNVPSEYMESLILPTSHARSTQVQDDEMVDITEPRFESFSMAIIKSPQHYA